METMKYRIETGRGEGEGVGDEVVTDMMGQPAQQGSLNALIALCPLGLSFPTHHLVAPSGCPRSLASLIRKWSVSRAGSGTVCISGHSPSLLRILFSLELADHLLHVRKKKREKGNFCGHGWILCMLLSHTSRGCNLEASFGFSSAEPPADDETIGAESALNTWDRSILLQSQERAQEQSTTRETKIPANRNPGRGTTSYMASWGRCSNVQSRARHRPCVKRVRAAVEESPAGNQGKQGPVNRRETGLARIISCAFT